MSYFALWALAFFLKAAGSAWDASYHFKYLFEKYSLPHLLNFSGFLLGAVLLAAEWKKLSRIDELSRNISTSGYALFLIGIPLDFSYHLLYGIDLTTWSPTHFVYYIGTGMMIAGAWLGYAKRGRPRRMLGIDLHGWFAFFALECALFPCMQQENGAISYYEFMSGRSIASGEILALLKNPSSQIFGGAPEWLYPVYSAAVAVAFSMLAAKWLKDAKIALFGASLYLGFRVAAKAVFWAVDYPTSYIPASLLLIPLLCWAWKSKAAPAVSASLSFLAAIALKNSGLAVAPPLEYWMAAPVCLAAVLVQLAFSCDSLSFFQRKKARP